MRSPRKSACSASGSTMPAQSRRRWTSPQSPGRDRNGEPRCPALTREENRYPEQIMAQAGKRAKAGRNAAAGRSAPCPCGRGKQFKRCHGLGARPAPRKLIPESVGTDLRIHRAPDGQEIVITLLAGV